MKILFDTNVLIAAFIAHGSCYELFEHCARQHSIFTSKFILDELQNNLHKKFKFKESEIKDVLNLLLSRLHVIDPIKTIKPTCRDKDDDHILAAALTSHCDCIITGDKDLLELIQYHHIPILKPANFWAFEAKVLA